jgi:hypothetical protein
VVWGGVRGVQVRYSSNGAQASLRGIKVSSETYGCLYPVLYCSDTSYSLCCILHFSPLWHVGTVGASHSSIDTSLNNIYSFTL